MRANIASNMHQVGMVGSNLITTPTKKLIYHTCVKEVDDNVKEAVIKYSEYNEELQKQLDATEVQQFLPETLNDYHVMNHIYT